MTDREKLMEINLEIDQVIDVAVQAGCWSYRIAQLFLPIRDKLFEYSGEQEKLLSDIEGAMTRLKEKNNETMD